MPTHPFGDDGKLQRLLLPVRVHPAVYEAVLASPVVRHRLGIHKSKGVEGLHGIEYPSLIAMEGELGIPTRVLVGIEVLRAHNGMLLAERDHRLEELVHRFVLLQARPVEPRDCVVLAIRVVVSPLRVAELVTRQDHGHAAAQQEQGGGVLYLPLAQRVYLLVLHNALGAAVPAVVVVGAVAVGLAVCLVVLVVVRDHVVEGKAVVTRDEVDACLGAAV